MTTRRLLPWLIALLFVVAVGFGIAVSQGWLLEPSVSRIEYVGVRTVAADEERLYQTVPFVWKVAGPAGGIVGRDIAHVRIDSSNGQTILCGWFRTDRAGTSMRAASWLGEARLRVGTLLVPATFIASVDSMAGQPAQAGCARLLDSAHPTTDATLELDGPPVHE